MIFKYAYIDNNLFNHSGIYDNDDEIITLTRSDFGKLLLSHYLFLEISHKPFLGLFHSKRWGGGGDRKNLWTPLPPISQNDMLNQKSYKF